MSDTPLLYSIDPAMMKILITITVVTIIQFTVIGQTNQRFTSLEEALKESENVKWVDLVCTDIPKMTKHVNKLTTLESLYLTGCKLEALPEGIGQIQSLGLLNIQDNDLRSLPAELKNLNKLTVVNLRNNGFEKLPKVLSTLPNLREIDLSGNVQLNLNKTLTTLRKSIR